MRVNYILFFDRSLIGNNKNYLLKNMLVWILILVYPFEALGQIESKKSSVKGLVDIYPTATKHATILYASNATNKEGNPKNLAAHYVFKGPGLFEWKMEIPEKGEYEVVLNYSARKNGASAKIISGKRSIAGPIEITSGVYAENKEWYQFNCERKLIPGRLFLAEGSNSLTLSLNTPDSSFETIIYSLELIPVHMKNEIVNDLKKARNARAASDWLSSMKYGVMFHWTSQSAPRSGPIKPYKKAVEDFDVSAFADMVSRTGAEYVIFTGNHAEPHFPAPLKVWEKVYPGWTTERDLISEISEALRLKNIRFILYLATHIYAKQDKVDTKEFQRLNDILISEIGDRYRDKVDGFWLDGFYQCYANHPTFDFEAFYKTCKTGNPNRIVALNSWLYPIVSEWQDYWAGEVYTPGTVPANKIIDSGPGKGLAFQGLVVLENDWVHDKIDSKIPSPRLQTNLLVNYISSCDNETIKDPVPSNP
jgi:Alpha-L-fucosidase